MDLDHLKTLREERVVTLLQMLGPDAMDSVFPLLPLETAALLKQRLARATDHPVSVRKQKQILEDFERFLQFSKVNASPALKLHTGEEDPEETGDEIEEEILELTGDPLTDIDRINVFQLAGALENEQPRTVALLLKSVSPKRIAQIVELLSDEKKQQVIGEMSHETRAPEIILRRMAASAIERAKTMPTEPRPKDDPVFRLVEVLRATEKPKRRQILKAIEDRSPDQAVLVNQSLYQFEDLLTMDDTQIQRILARVDSSTLSTALFDSDERILERIFSNLSKRARASLQEELSFRKNVTGAQLRAARQLVTSAIAESEQETES